MATRISPNSTNARTRIPASARAVVGARRLALEGLGKISHERAAAYAERLFTTPRRHVRPGWEKEALEAARRADVYLDGQVVPTWSWGPARAPAALLVHGWEGRGSQLASFVPDLLALGLRVVTFDAPGHGDAGARREAIVDHARATCAVAELAGDVRLVVAHSMGGAAALLATRFGLRAQAFALVAPPTSPAGFVDGFSRAYAISREVREAMLERLERRFGIPVADLDARLDACRLEAPILVVHDEGARAVPVEEGRRIAEAAKDARLVTTRGLGHRRILRAPEVLREVGNFAAAFAAPRPASGAPSWGASLAAAIDAELFFREARWESSGSAA